MNISDEIKNISLILLEINIKNIYNLIKYC